MHYAHVKHKEQTMNRYMMEEFHDDPALFRKLAVLAHRERSRAIREAFASLVGYVKARLTPRSILRPARWIGRLG
jgi:hypothetical protein